MNYDFSQLNDKEFEILSADLLSTVFNKRIERFKAGKDSGIDGRFFSDNNQEIILQCKHYLKTGDKGLISRLKNKEVVSVKKLNPKRYIFITSIQLSRKNKIEIKKIFSPFIKRDDDIYGQEDLNDILSKNREIEEKYFKLWITSTNVFNRIINNAIKGRSEFELEQIKNKSYKYIQTENHNKAFEILRDKHVLIISGEPGIGKTTLAENLCLYFASKNFEFIDIEESLSEAENIYTKGKRQIFYYNDFLGSNYFEAIENKKDSHISKFIERIKNDKLKYFILTSRTNILNSGVWHSNIFSNNKIRKNEYMLTIESLTELDKAKILYNHIWFSKLEEKFIDEIYKEKKYRKVIKHKNFNPRLIEFITDVDRVNNYKYSDYWNYIQETLNNPKDIWNDCFKIQNNAFVRNLVFLTVFNGGNIKVDELRESFDKLNKAENLKSESHTEKDFDSMTRLAIKSFLNRSKINDKVEFSLFNPSITDFVLKEYSKNNEKLISIFKSLNSIKSLDTLISLEKEKIISRKDSLIIKNAIFEYKIKHEKNYDYLIYVSNLFLGNINKKEKLIKIIKKIINEPKVVTELSKLFKLLTEYWKYLDVNGCDFLLKCIGSQYIDEIEILDFADFLYICEINDEDIINEFNINLEYILKEELASRKDEVDLSDVVEIGIGSDEASTINYVEGYEDIIKDELTRIVESIINDFEKDFITNHDIDIYNVVNEIDIDEMIDEYFRSQDHDEYEPISIINIDQDIDDLFERS
ncbi:MAG: restriction endonuclease [Ignavibacteria bacterium]|nr:restriction endonuclease [Ignavibacteria bacterium]